MVRVKYRYLLIQIERTPLTNLINFKNPLTLTDVQLKNFIFNTVELNYGDLGISYLLGSFSVKYLSKETGLAIIRVTRDYYKELATCLTLINQLDSQPVVITILHCSGTIIKCQRSAIKHNKELIYSSYKQLEKMESNDDSIDLNSIENLIVKERERIEATEF
ncbi:hypothetical protein CONCODRAFT_8235 [Conidiobolus coronatus NRRL 28638]|uniref:Ribonuclease P/MRP protein subunit POP5 n=1 Tax=Conidiobolus coronatus (strain ATCC 28846 / CBS 209.66 / NRRL 28638) TaxID=796925 RepID=A0A137P324_CONC2|nr:hypothetical protein CONCODRAFT_8235 [Conidiobolus coronatus NRRL 28638]|eukprot:KXN69378.1 hypothetical protein CONCODRAFT_8235 [Conidiobolus coronatus NRRL 28638]